MLGTVGTIAREEGLSALWKGIVPGLHRQCVYGGLRIGLYEPVSFESQYSNLFSCFSLYLCFLVLWCVVNSMGCLQVKSLYVGKDHVGDVPLSKKILAGFTTGKAQCCKLWELFVKVLSYIWFTFLAWTCVIPMFITITQLWTPTNFPGNRCSGNCSGKSNWSCESQTSSRRKTTSWCSQALLWIFKCLFNNCETGLCFPI